MAGSIPEIEGNLQIGKYYCGVLVDDILTENLPRKAECTPQSLSGKPEVSLVKHGAKSFRITNVKITKSFVALSREGERF